MCLGWFLSFSFLVRVEGKFGAEGLAGDRGCAREHRIQHLHGVRQSVRPGAYRFPL